MTIHSSSTLLTRITMDSQRDENVWRRKNLRLVSLSQIPEDENLRRQWDALLERTEDPQIFYTYEWALAVQRAYADQLGPMIYLAYDDRDALCGVAALARDISKGQVSFLCATTGDYCDFLSTPADRPAFISAIFAELKKEKVRNLRLTNLPADSPTFPAIQEQARRCGYYYTQRLAYVCSQFSLQSLDRAKNETPRLARSKMIRRSLRAMGSEGPIRLDHSRSRSEAASLLPQFIRSHVARFLVTGRISNLARVERRVFLLELAGLLSTSNWLCLTRMMTGKKTVAWNYGFQFYKSWFWYQPTFDSAVEKHSPGYCLLAKIIEEAAQNPELTLVDLGLGAEEYKDRVANQSRKTVALTMKTSAAEHAFEIARDCVAKLAKASPRIERGVRSVLAAVNSQRKRVHEHGLRETVVWTFQRMRSVLFARDEVFFYELISKQQNGESCALKQIDLDLLADAAMLYSDDQDTLAYLLRCAEHLRQENCAGYALLNADGQPVHFTWAAPFAGFHWSELDSALPAPSRASVVIFDSWTPVAQRGRGYYAPTLASVAARIRQEGKQPWSFSAAPNTFAVRALKKMGFPRRFSIVRHKMLWWQRLSRRGIESAAGSEMQAA
jgi:CelD/BcsL family acetyltransferase involved in cellulose biosynthesis